MATVTIKRFLMLTSESDGIKLIIQLCSDNIYKHPEFKMFIEKMNQYFNKIQLHPSYEQNVDYIVSVCISLCYVIYRSCHNLYYRKYL